MVREQRSLAAEGMLGRQLATQLWILDDLDGGRDRGFQFSQHGGIREGDRAVDLLEDLVAQRERRVWIGREAFEIFRPVGFVFLRKHPVRRALEEVDLARLLDDLGNELDGTCRTSDHADRLSREVVIPIPLRGVEARARERVATLDLGPRDFVEHADRADHDIGLDRLARFDFERPARGALVPASAPNFGIETTVREQLVLLGAMLQVGANFGLGRVRTRPVALGLERERIQMRLDITGATRVAVVVPGAADALTLLEQDEVLEARLLQPNRHAQTAGSRPNDRDPQASRPVLRCAHAPSPPILPATRRAHAPNSRTPRPLLISQNRQDCQTELTSWPRRIYAPPMRSDSRGLRSRSTS